MFLVSKAVCAAPMDAIRARSILARLIATRTASSSLCFRQRLRRVPASKMGTARRRLREDRFLRGCRRQTALDVVAHPRLENADDDLQHTCCGARTYARFLSVDSRLTEFRLTAILLEREVSFEVFPSADPGARDSGRHRQRPLMSRQARYTDIAIFHCVPSHCELRHGR